jgi:hypothetical protein
VNKQQWFVTAGSDATDARQSILTEHGPGYIGVFSGKVNHSVWVADEIAEMIGTSVAEPLSQLGV